MTGEAAGGGAAPRKRAKGASLASVGVTLPKTGRRDHVLLQLQDESLDLSGDSGTVGKDSGRAGKKEG